ncbi:hypothetical protein DPMN_151086 [Dreissena polymorpha]|uniref:PHD-type domain-containing protein n=1 Tax=Dreissena polymorpha TaxID=45954 RepID=A0A9D4FJ80_DREPO|nr:hypothetical protein DPMN_151086 [Dreissena polymorpha]
MECADVSESEPGTSAIQPEPSSSEPATSAIQPEPPSSIDDPDSIHTIAATVAEQAGIELDEDESCGKCGKVGKEGIQWIQCSSCNTWLHRNCAGLRSKAKWERFSNTTAQFYCNDCK